MLYMRICRSYCAYLFLNANTVAQVLGVSISSAYELMHEMGFPALRIASFGYHVCREALCGVQTNRYTLDLRLHGICLPDTENLKFPGLPDFFIACSFIIIGKPHIRMRDNIIDGTFFGAC